MGRCDGMTLDATALAVNRRVFIGGAVAFLTSCTRYRAALPDPACDYVQVSVDLRRQPPLRIPPAAPDEAPTSGYCSGQPQQCSSTHVRDIREARAVSALT